jgi:hypothetical protein
MKGGEEMRNYRLGKARKAANLVLDMRSARIGL